jgi:DNA-binding XRE family transcriptional regulator
MNAILYIHGKGGSATESEHYKPLFPDNEVIGLDYQTFTPWETGKGRSSESHQACLNGRVVTELDAVKEIRIAVEELKGKYENAILIANSIGAFFSMNAGIDEMIQSVCLKLTFRMCKFYPELMDELKRTLEAMEIDYYKPAVKCVRNRILSGKLK